MTRIKEILMADARYKRAIAELNKIKNIEDDNERQKAVDEAAKLIVAVAYDRAEAYDLLAFVLIESADILLRASSEMLSTVRDNVKYKDKFKLNEAKRALDKVITTFDIESQSFHNSYFKFGEVEDSNMSTYDAIEQNARIILHFVMLIYNALQKNKGNAEMLEKYIRRLKGGKDIFSIQEIQSL
jgi:hypothetical protein